MKTAIFLILVTLLIGQTWGQGRRAPQSVGSQPNSRRSQVPSPPSSTPAPPPSRGVPRNKPEEPEEGEDDDDPAPFTCPRSDGLYADPSNCKRFYLCGAYHAYSQACPPSLYFDDKLKFCTFKTAALVCGPVEEDPEEKISTNQEKLTICNKQTCQLPNCFCSDEGTTIPGSLPVSQVPQFILLSFSGAVNELVFDPYKKILGYSGKYSTTQSRNNPNGCGIKSTFFINHEYANYAEIQWLAAQGHEIGLHTITHRTPETWWTDRANYSQWAEEVIGMREILLKFANGGVTTNGVLTRDNIVGHRGPYFKPGGDAMFEMLHDFGLMYDSTIVAPRSPVPIWPFTFDHRQPFDCSNNAANNNNGGNGQSGSSSSEGRADILNSDGRNGRGPPPGTPQRQKRSTHLLDRSKRSSPYLGRPLKCPTKAYPGLWEIPINPYFNEFNTCHHLDQCVFPSADETDDGSDIVDFLTDNFNRHYSTNRAPFQLNFHVTWFTSKTKVRALNKFIEQTLKDHKDVYFVTFQQLISWMKDPQPLGTWNPKCEEPKSGACNRPHTCVLKHYLDKNGEAAQADEAVRSDTRYMPICHPTSCPSQYPWYGNHAGSTRNFKTIMALVDEALGADGNDNNNNSNNSTQSA